MLRAQHGCMPSAGSSDTAVTRALGRVVTVFAAAGVLQPSVQPAECDLHMNTQFAIDSTECL